MLIDHFLPEFDFSEHHELAIEAREAVVYDELLRLDLSSSHIIAGLLWLRRLPATVGRAAPRPAAKLTMDGVLGDGFVILDEDRPREIVLGTVGRFWRPRGDLQSFEPEEFSTLSSPGYARAAWNFTTTEADGVTVLATETRIKCSDEAALRSFGRYWRLVRPFSGVIRREMLKAVRRQAEARSC